MASSDCRDGRQRSKEVQMSEHDYEELSLWHGILEDAVNGKTDQLKCPCGEDAPVEAEVARLRHVMMA
jgi:hypothetical protein